MKVNWEKIKNGFSGFEALALQYVKEICGNEAKWKDTGDTRDGNKDGVAVIVGYQDDTKQWWMEAKYSTKKDILTRYRIDATVVSAILNENVSKVIFVTNIVIEAKTISDIRQALFKSIGCNEVYFYSKYTLEYWLIHNPKIYNSLFDDAILPENNDNQDNNSLLIIHDISFFDSVNSYLSFREPVRELYYYKNYFAYFSVYSERETSASISVPHRIKGIRILSKKQIQLCEGENQVCFSFELKDNYGHNTTKKGKEYLTPPSPCFRIGNIEVPSRYAVTINKHAARSLKLPSQEAVLSSIKKQIKHFLKTGSLCVNLILGDSGVGKSFLLDNLFQIKELISQNVYYCDFNESNKENSKKVLNLILFILLPFLSPEMIDEDYINHISALSQCRQLKRLVKRKNNYDSLLTLLSQTIDEDIFPDRVEISKRIIIVDNLQKLNHNLLNFFKKIIIEIQNKRIPIYMCLAAQPMITNNAAFLELKQNVFINIHTLKIGIDDICLAFNHTNNQTFFATEDLFRYLEFNALELFVYAKYLDQNSINVKDIKDFIFTLQIYKKSGVLMNYILSLFKNAFNNHPSIKWLCDLIYWSSSPIEYSEEFLKDDSLKTILELGLAKYNNEAKLTPVHDIYTQFYRYEFPVDNIEQMPWDEDSYELISYNIFNSLNPVSISQSLEKVLELIESKKYYSVMYILQSVFERKENQMSFKRRTSLLNYYTAALYYSLAALQQNNLDYCIDLFNEIIKEGENSNEVKMLHLSAQAYWELIYINYENMTIDKCEKLLEKMRKTISKISILESGFEIKESIYYYNIAVMDALIQANYRGLTDLDALYDSVSKEIMESGFMYRYQSFRARFALAYCIFDIEKCLMLLEKSKTELTAICEPTDKHLLWCDFYINFYRLIFEKNTYCLNNMLNAHAQMKINQITNYRKKLYAIAGYFYMVGDISTGNKYLLQESSFTDVLSSRSKGFYNVTVSLYEILNNNYNKAIAALETAERLFADHKSYYNIVAHNLQLVKSRLFCPQKIDFWFGGQLKSDIFYLDSRGAW